jgi:SAM-dependent methyltransferase
MPAREEGQLGMPRDREIERLTNVYREYGSTVAAARWNPENSGNRMILGELERRIASILRARGLLPLTDRRILDVGCGYGHFLDVLRALGASPTNLHGIDLLPERIEIARSQYPDIDFQVANAEALPYVDSSFDLLLVFSVFTSVLDPSMRTNIAAELRRVRRPGGSILWYDFRYDNPWNPHVRGMSRAEIAETFPGFTLDVETLTLLPPLARRLGPLAPILYPVLAAAPFLHTHYLGLLGERSPDV